MTAGAGVLATPTPSPRTTYPPLLLADKALAPDIAGPFEGEQEILRYYLTANLEAFLGWMGRLVNRTIAAQVREGRDELAAKEIRRVGGRYYVYTTTGRRLGSYPTLAGARRRLRQVEFFRFKAGPTIPGRPESWWTKYGGVVPGATNLPLPQRGKPPPTMPRLTEDPAFWNAVQTQFNADLNYPSRQVMTKGALAVKDLGFVGINYGLINSPVAALSNSFTNDWWEALERDTRNQLRGSINTWLQSGKPLSHLTRDLTPLFGRARAETIAATETTRLFAEGNAVSYRAAGVREVEWYTSMDDRVCPICGPRHGERYGVGTTKPPAHTRCRCWMAPVVDGKARTARTQYKHLDGEARKILTKARAAEPKITADMERIAKLSQQHEGRTLFGKKLPSGDLTGLDERLKKRASLSHKMNNMFSLEGEAIEGIPSRVSDAVRFTQIADERYYMETMQRTLPTLDSEGYRVVKFKNYWGGPDYQGVNVVLQSPDGQLFELQFHTPHSYHTKEYVTHPLYEQARVLPNGAAKQALNDQMAEIWKTVRVPEEATGYEWGTVVKPVRVAETPSGVSLSSIAKTPTDDTITSVLEGTGQKLPPGGAVTPNVAGTYARTDIEQWRSTQNWADPKWQPPGVRPIDLLYQGNALEKYKGSYYDTVNGYLRGKSKLPLPASKADLKQWVTYIDSALDGYRLSQPIKVYRSVGQSARMTPGGKEIWKAAVGDPYWDAAYSSASVSRQFTSSWKGSGYLLEINVPAGTPTLWMERELLPSLTREAEFLFPRELPCHVVDIKYLRRGFNIEYSTPADAVTDALSPLTATPSFVAQQADLEWFIRNYGTTEEAGMLPMLPGDKVEELIREVSSRMSGDELANALPQLGIRPKLILEVDTP